MAKSKKREFDLSALVKWSWLFLGVGLLFTFAIFVLVSFTKMPDTEELENPDYEQASIIYAADQTELGRYFSKNRELINFEEMNPHLINALVATEDERYFNHSGIDGKSTARAILFMGKRGGASTITQQLAKQFFTKRSRSFIPRVWQKMKEWVIAVEFEKRYTKEEILAMYLNKFDFIHDSYGVASASKTYFGKPQADLTVDEAAILVGMLKNPWIYNPKRKPDNAAKRRNVVMRQMVKNKFLSPAEYETLKNKEIDLSNFKRSQHFEGLAPYFRATLTSYIKDLLNTDKYRKPDGTKYDIFEDGLRIYTTIDKDMQTHAEAAMYAHMPDVQKKFFSVWQNRDPWTYGADSRQKDIRIDALNKAVRDSERYLKMKNSFLGEVFNKITEKFPDARLWDADISRMLQEEADPRYLNKIKKQDFINGKQANTYKAILRDPLWQELKEKRRELDKSAQQIFNQEVQMRVFAYNEDGEKTVTMTPLDSIQYHHKHLQIGSVSMDPRNGYVKTWVGGIGNKYFKYDHVQSNRQVGSTFKPFLYATALAFHGISPCQKVKDVRHQIPAGDPNFGLLETWAPNNSDGKFTEEDLTLKDALKKSKNSISVWLVKELGSVELIRQLVDNMGIPKRKIPNAPSIVLGASQVNVLEMTGAYGAFANNGVFTQPIFLLRIEDKDGKVIYNAVPSRKKVLAEKYNDAMVKFLEHASSDHKWRLKTKEWGGKTGTTNDFVDGWFMGISPELVVGTWVGGTNNWIRFLSIADGSGGAMARPYFFEFMQRLERDPAIDIDHNAQFPQPEGELIVFDCDQYEQLVSSKDEKDRAVKIKSMNDAFDDDFENN